MKVQILCDEQQRLRGDYNDVFNNFDNPDYFVPERKVFYVDIDDDDIPF